MSDMPEKIYAGYYHKHGASEATDGWNIHKHGTEYIRSDLVAAKEIPYDPSIAQAVSDAEIEFIASGNNDIKTSTELSISDNVYVAAYGKALGEIARLQRMYEEAREEVTACNQTVIEQEAEIEGLRNRERQHEECIEGLADEALVYNAEIARLQRAVVNLADELTHGKYGALSKYKDTIEAARKALGEG